MATSVWNGGAAAVTQVDTLTPANVEIDDIFTVTLTSEPDKDGNTTTQSESFTATGASIANVTAGLTNAINNSTKSMFANIITATDQTTHVQVTADVAGVPFYCTTAATDGGGTNNQTLTQATTTANAGPNDVNTAANYEGSAVFADGDDLVAADGQHSLLYGLDQSAKSLKSFRRARGFLGSIGDLANGFYLNVDVANTDGGNTPKFVFEGTGQHCLINGTITNVSVIGGGAGANMLRLNGDIDYIRIAPEAGAGTVSVEDGAVLDYVQCMSEIAKVIIGENVTSFDSIEATGGSVKSSSAVATINASGSAKVTQQKGNVTTAINNRTSKTRGGWVKWNSDGTLTKLNNYDGPFDTRENKNESTIITDAEIWDGEILEDGALANVTHTNPITKHGGDVKVGSTVSIAPST